jgi:uncharacterized protein
MNIINATQGQIVESLQRALENDQSVIFAILFGSAARNELTRQSDVDCGIYFTEPPEGMDKLDYISDLSNRTGFEIDVAVLNSASPLLRHQVMKDRIIIINRNLEVFYSFRERTMADYEEYCYLNGYRANDR